MPSNQQDAAKSTISPVLFMTVEGEPMSFFLRPGPVKCKLQPLITAGGGMMCKVQKPGAILLIDPEERGSIPETSAHWYVSTQYIHDCIEKDEQLYLEDYRLNPEVVPRSAARLNSTKESSPGTLAGRIAYTSEDDAAILSYVSKHKAEIGGNRLWQEMEKQRVTGHSWQSMKYRYRVRLAKIQTEEATTAEEDTETAEKETKVEENQETDVEKPSSAQDAASSQTHSAESDLTQIDPQSAPAEITQPEMVEPQTSISPQGEEQHVSPQTDKQPDESSHVETAEDETSDSPRPEGPCLDAQTDVRPIPAESTEPEADESQTVISPPEESLPEGSPPAQPKSLPDASSQKKPKEKQKASPKLQQPQRRLTRRQLQLEESSSPEPYGKKLRSSSNPAEQQSSSPRPLKKNKAAVKSLQKDTTADEPPSKRCRGKSAAAAVTENQQDESGPVSEAAQPDTESNSVPQKGEKKKGKRKLGILELATKEFEDESESDENEAPDLQNSPDTAAIQPASTDPASDTAAEAVSTQSNPERGPVLQEDEDEAQTSSSNSLPETSCPQAAATEPAAAEAVSAPSAVHMFIFESQEEEDDSQSVLGVDAAAPSKQQPTGSKDAAFSLTQVQLEEDKQRITELMSQTKQDLVSVTKALLKTSGDLPAALELLLNPCSISGPLWDRHDDSLLLSADPVVRQQLQEKYGEEGVAKRVVFLEVEG